MYFESALAASLGVKPLLLYYGAMSLAVGLVLFKDQEKDEESFKTHGLKLLNWKKTLSNGLENVLRLKIKANPGTFRQLADNTWNWYIAQTYQGDLQKRDFYPELRHLGAIAFARDDSALELRDLISRSKYTGGDFGDITGEPNRLHRAAVRLERGGHNITIKYDISVPERFKQEQSFPRFPRQETSMPLYHLSGESYMSVVDNFANNDRLSEFLKLYLMAYVLGMLARYFPSKWMTLIHNEQGSGAQPLLAKATKALENEFVREFGQQVAVIVNDPYFFGEHFGFTATCAAGDWRNGWRTED